MKHELKIHPWFFDDVIEERKTWEIRSNKDRDFKEGDELELQEYDPFFCKKTGRKCRVIVTFVTELDTIDLPGIVGMSIRLKAVVLEGGKR